MKLQGSWKNERKLEYVDELSMANSFLKMAKSFLKIL